MPKKVFLKGNLLAVLFSLGVSLKIKTQCLRSYTGYRLQCLQGPLIPLDTKLYVHIYEFSGERIASFCQILEGAYVPPKLRTMALRTVGVGSAPP